MFGGEGFEGVDEGLCLSGCNVQHVHVRLQHANVRTHFVHHLRVVLMWCVVSMGCVVSMWWFRGGFVMVFLGYDGCGGTVVMLSHDGI